MVRISLIGVAVGLLFFALILFNRSSHISRIINEGAYFETNVNTLSFSDLDLSLSGPGDFRIKENHFRDQELATKYKRSQMFVCEGVPVAVFYGNSARKGYVYLFEWGEIDMLGFKVDPDVVKVKGRLFFWNAN